MKILTQSCVALASTLVIGSVLDANSGLAATLNFQDVTQGLLRFRDNTGTQIGSGSFEYSQVPFEGTFIFGTGPAVGGGPGTYFITEPNQIKIPEDILPIKTVAIAAEQNLRLVKNTSINILGALFENQRPDLSPGQFFGTALLFQPTQNTFFPPGPGGPFGVSTGGARNPDLVFENRWFLGNTGTNPQQQLSMSDDGSFSGFDLSLSPPTQSFSGKWEAEAVPEPFTFLGAASALGFGAYFNRKFNRKEEKQKGKIPKEVKA